MRHMTRLPSILLLCFSLTIIPPLHAEDSPLVLTEEVQMKLADAFLGEGEYYRAITEFKKFLILFPDSKKADYAWFRIGLANLQGEEFGPAARTFSTLRQKYPESAYSLQAGYLEGISHWKMKGYNLTLMILAEISEGHPGSEYAPRALAAAGLVALDEDKADLSRRNLERFLERYPGHSGVENVRDALAYLDQYERLPEKSPVLAGALSAILPGSGYMYAGRYGDGFTAFLINGLFIAGTVTGIHNENYALSAIVGGIGVPFYLGNIYGSANAAKKWNLEVKREVLRKVHDSLAPLI
jgi:outer membrane protein assembly factor BamD (BamD/ComL family)/TM2 domain-containing membrane protein YozV